MVCFTDVDPTAFLAALGGEVTFRAVVPPPRYTARQLALGVVSPLPLYVHLEASSAFRAAVRRELEFGCHVILCELTAMYEHVRDAGMDDRVVIDTHNIDSIIFERYQRTQPTMWRRLYARISAAKLRAYERDVFRRVHAVVVCSEEEAVALRDRTPGAPVWVVPNGADTGLPLPEIPVHPERLFFFGRLDYHPNRDAIEYFVNTILPSIRSARPGVEFHVAGADNGTVERLLAGVPGTRFHGRVPQLAPELAASAVVVVPLRVGGGTRLKILEAMAAGRPVVSSSVGAEGLQVSSGHDIILADDPAAFADAVLDLLADPERAAALGAEGRRTVERQYGWQSIEDNFTMRVLRNQEGGRSV